MRRCIFVERAFLAVAILLSASCSMPLKPAEGPAFREVPTPPGQSVVYLFRPAFTEYRAAEQPDVYVDGQYQFPLAWKGYAPLLLMPGEHLVEIRPSHGASGDWQMQFKINPVQDEHYYLAIWNAAVGSSMSSMATAPIGHALFFIPISTTAYKDRGTHYELVKEEDALAVLRTCRLMTSLGQNQ